MPWRLATSDYKRQKNIKTKEAMFKYEFGDAHKNSPFYYVRNKVVIRLVNLRGLRGIFVLVDIHNMKLFEKRQNKS